MSEFLESLSGAVDEYRASHGRSAWSRGVGEYVSDFYDELKYARGNCEVDALGESELDRFLLNGASGWSEYSWSGCSLIYNSDIAERLCCPSELKRTDYGRLQPNSREHWLDVQARALSRAAIIFERLYRQTQSEMN